MCATPENPYHGGCLCGKLSFIIKGPIKDIIHCHCSRCRKNTGSAFTSNGFMQKDDFELVTGHDVIKAYSNGQGGSRYFCGDCGSPIYSANEKDQMRIRIRIGAIDSDISERPISHNFVPSKASWEEMDADLPRYETYEPARLK